MQYSSCGISELRKYANRKRHIFNLKEDQIKYNNNPSALLTKKVNSKGHIEDVKRAEIKLAAFFAEHNIALRTLDHMVPLLKNIYNKPEIANDLSLSRKKCTKIITNVIGKRESEKTIEILRKQRFSILIDESTTISNDKVLCILVKYFHPIDKKIITELLELLELDATNCSADKLYNAFKNCFQTKEIPLQNIVGMASDNASVMTGIHDSFVTRLRNEVPCLILLKCICHSSALIASKASSKLPDSCEHILHAIATYISSSPKRSAILCEYQTFFGVETRKILKLSGTRWLVLQKCVTRLLENWEVFKHYFYLEVFEVKNKSAQDIHNLLEDDHVKAYMLFLKYVLHFFNQFNALFQSRATLIHKLSRSSQQLIEQIGYNFLIPEALKNMSIDMVESRNFLPANKIYLGPECERFLLNHSSEFVQEIKLKCLDFYITATEEMIKRLPFNDIIFRDLNFLNFQIVLGDQARTIVPNLTHIATHFGTFDITTLAFEWRILPTMFNDADKDILASLNLEDMWNKIFETKNFNDQPMFPNLEKLVYAIFSLPHSNAEAERIFSIVTDVKDKKRNRMNIDTLNAMCKIRSAFQARNIDCRTFQVDERHLELCYVQAPGFFILREIRGFGRGKE